MGPATPPGRDALPDGPVQKARDDVEEGGRGGGPRHPNLSCSDIYRAVATTRNCRVQGYRAWVDEYVASKYTVASPARLPHGTRETSGLEIQQFTQWGMRCCVRANPDLEVPTTRTGVTGVYHFHVGADAGWNGLC